MFQFNRFFSLFRFKTSRQLLFSIGAGVMVLFVFGIVIFCSYFLATHLGNAFSDTGPTSMPQPASFDIAGFEQLHLNEQR
jgi:hypothetical protein